LSSEGRERGSRGLRLGGKGKGKGDFYNYVIFIHEKGRRRGGGGEGREGALNYYS